MWAGAMLLASLVAPHTRLLPGAPAAPTEWPRFLFHFRAAHGSGRLDEVRAVMPNGRSGHARSETMQMTRAKQA